MMADTSLKCPFAPYQEVCGEDTCRLWMARRNKCAFEVLALDLREILRRIQAAQDGDE